MYDVINEFTGAVICTCRVEGFAKEICELLNKNFCKEIKIYKVVKTTTTK